MNLFFWHNIISPHQASFMRELAGAGHEVTVVSAEAMTEARRKLGWAIPSLGRARTVLSPDANQVVELVNSSTPDSIHFIAGARGIPLGRQAAIACRINKRRMGIITEAPDMRGLGGLLRWMKYSRERIMIGREFDFILAMGEKGVRWFRRFGYSPRRIFPFAYVTEPLAGSASAKPETGFHFLFVGQLISRKGVDLLLQSLARVPRCSLSLIGDGAEKNQFQLLAQKYGLENRVAWHGSMSTAKVHNWIAMADVLILPSREDGWGAVVNESLMAGTPVICSSACGAADLIRRPWLGTVFPTNNVAALAKTMTQWTAQGKILPEQRQRIQNWAQCIEAPVVARYVEEILNHVYNCGPRPDVPWRRASP